MAQNRIACQMNGTARVLLMFFAAVMLVACSGTNSEPAIPGGANLQSWFDNGAEGRYILNVIHGVVPRIESSGARAMVMTDSNCAPDAEGLNHCHNIIRFEDGTRIEVVNNHQMSRHRCLRPGESVRVKQLKGAWIQLQTQE